LWFLFASFLIVSIDSFLVSDLLLPSRTDDNNNIPQMLLLNGMMSNTKFDRSLELDQHDKDMRAHMEDLNKAASEELQTLPITVAHELVDVMGKSEVSS
jgi:hypothetical protein